MALGWDGNKTRPARSTDRAADGERADATCGLSLTALHDIKIQNISAQKNERQIFPINGYLIKFQTRQTRVNDNL